MPESERARCNFLYFAKQGNQVTEGAEPTGVVPSSTANIRDSKGAMLQVPAYQYFVPFKFQRTQTCLQAGVFVTGIVKISDC
jgi:hypothetical protein